MTECRLKGQNYLDSHDAWILRLEIVAGRNIWELQKWLLRSCLISDICISSDAATKVWRTWVLNYPFLRPIAP